MPEDVFPRVKKIIVEQLGVEEDEVVPTASFVEDLNADSLDLVELIMSLEEEFGMEISDEEAEKADVPTYEAPEPQPVHLTEVSPTSVPSEYETAAAMIEPMAPFPEAPAPVAEPVSAAVETIVPAIEPTLGAPEVATAPKPRR